MSSNNISSIIIVGGGLVGSLCGIYMAQRGHNVTIFEYREDIRKASHFRGRSINMALSNRGRNALAGVGLENLILKSAIPMKGRLLHDLEGHTKSVPYDAKTSQCIYSISRNYLNEVLLTGLENYSNVKVLFNHKVSNVNFEDETITVLNLNTQERSIHSADLIIGADGAYSSIRRAMQHTPLFEFSQNYIKHGYLELSIPPKNGHQMIPNHLHIWPRGEFMMIALPNQDKSWTVTLFMPFAKFDALKTSHQLIDFFKRTFPDSVDLIEEEMLTSDFFQNKPSPLVSIKCNPYHVGKKFLVIGDAAHAMVPFYGQGMNAGFEDCVIFDKILCKNKNDIGTSIQEFSETRIKDAQAICDLAMYNYVEMRDLVTKRSYYLRKRFDEFLFTYTDKWTPLYNSVTFSQMNYEKCIENRKWQDAVIQYLLIGFVALFILTVAMVFKAL